MFTMTTALSESEFRVSRDTGEPGTIWIRNDDGLAISVTYAEAAQLVAGVTRELRAAETEARGVAA